MTPLTALNNNVTHDKYTENNAINALYQKLESGFQSLKTDTIYTLEEAWKEIDKI